MLQETTQEEIVGDWWSLHPYSGRGWPIVDLYVHRQVVRVVILLLDTDTDTCLGKLGR